MICALPLVLSFWIWLPGALSVQSVNLTHT